MASISTSADAITAAAAGLHGSATITAADAAHGPSPPIQPLLHRRRHCRHADYARSVHQRRQRPRLLHARIRLRARRRHLRATLVAGGDRLVTNSSDQPKPSFVPTRVLDVAMASADACQAHCLTTSGCDFFTGRRRIQLHAAAARSAALLKTALASGGSSIRSTLKDTSRGWHWEWGGSGVSRRVEACDSRRRHRHHRRRHLHHCRRHLRWRRRRRWHRRRRRRRRVAPASPTSQPHATRPIATSTVASANGAARNVALPPPPPSPPPPPPPPSSPSPPLPPPSSPSPSPSAAARLRRPGISSARRQPPSPSRPSRLSSLLPAA